MEPLAFGARLWLAITLPWKILFDAALAARVHRIDAPAELPAAPAVVETEPEPDLNPALQLLGILQREGRLVDFLQEDVTTFSDAEIGAAARVVHDGCKRALADYVRLSPIRAEQEGTKLELPPGYDAARHRVVGNVVGEPPFTGTLSHHGWSVERIHLPALADGHDPRIIAPAEVELA